MNSIFKILITSLVLATPALAQSDDGRWVAIGGTNDGDVWSIDVMSVKDVQDGYNQIATKVWINIDYQKDQKEIARSAKVLSFFKCDEELGKSTTWIDYNANGTVLRDNSQSYAAYTPVVPGSVFASVMQATCYARDLKNK